MNKNTQQKMDFLPYGRQDISKDDIDAVVRVLQSDWLTTGPWIERFERDVSKVAGSRYAAAVSSGTAALHAAMYAIDLKPGDEVIVPPITFAATANAVVYMGGVPVFADVKPDTLLIDPAEVEKKITVKTKAVISVDYAGQMCEYDRLKETCRKHDIILVADACHSIGAQYMDKPSGSWADLTVFSFHPVKHITTGEGGMAVTDSKEFIERVWKFRNHGIDSDLHQRQEKGSWYYEIEDPGFNYRLTDFQSALGVSQLKKLQTWIQRRNEIARQYTEFFGAVEQVSPLDQNESCLHAYHLYVIRLNFDVMDKDRQAVFSLLHQSGIGVNVHYIPVHYHPFYRKKFNTAKGMCPEAEHAYERILTIPLFPGMTDDDADRVCRAVSDVVSRS